MPLTKPSGNMYSFIDYLWNPIKGECPYHCSYCYVSRMMDKYGKKQSPLHLDEKELKTNLGSGNFIFVCSGCDLFHPDVPDEWIYEVIKKTLDNWDNKYLWHTKNPRRLVSLIDPILVDNVACVTIESDIDYVKISAAPSPSERIMYLRNWYGNAMITIEPIMDFSLDRFKKLILSCKPIQVNIGADSGNNHLPEPSPEKIAALIEALRSHNIRVHLKKNLKRLYKETV
jgi:DNA repair photolyase